MKIKSCPAYIALAMAMSACNNDIFIDPLDLAVSAPLVGWEGGDCVISVNEEGLSAIVSIVRQIDGQGEPLFDIPLNTDLQGSCKRHFDNSLFGISMSLEPSAHTLTFDIDHNYYPDTIVIISRIYGKYDNKNAKMAVLPAPRFEAGEIDYQLFCWTSEEISYIESAYTYINGLDETRRHKICSAGQTLARSTGYFRPWDVEISEALFEGRDLKVPLIEYLPDKMIPTVSDRTIDYTMAPQILDKPDLHATEDSYIDVPPGAVCDITIIVRAEKFGFDYNLPASSPDGKATVNITGRYWQQTPLEYVIKAEIREQ